MHLHPLHRQHYQPRRQRVPSWLLKAWYWF